MPGATLFETVRTRVSAADEADGDALSALFERCEDFFQLVYGQPPGPAEVQSFFVALPDGKTYDDKFAAAIFDTDGRVIGALDAIRDYIEPGRWALGLMLLDPEHRGAGFGREVYEGFERWAAGLGARLIRLLVQVQNTGAHAFWTRMGFEQVDTVHQRTGILDSECAVMARRVPEAS